MVASDDGRVEAESGNRGDERTGAGGEDRPAGDRPDRERRTFFDALMRALSAACF